MQPNITIISHNSCETLEGFFTTVVIKVDNLILTLRSYSKLFQSEIDTLAYFKASLLFDDKQYTCQYKIPILRNGKIYFRNYSKKIYSFSNLLKYTREKFKRYNHPDFSFKFYFTTMSSCYPDLNSVDVNVS